MQKKRSEHYDVAIIGSGIAGLSAAITLAQANKKVVLITKKKLMSSATNHAQGGIAAVLSQLDSIEKHVEDTMIAGSFHNKKSVVTYMAKNSKKAVEWLLSCGVAFATLDGELQLTREGGHSMRRIAYVGDYTGKAIEQALVKRCRREKNITVLTDTCALELLVKEKKCIGVVIAKHLSKNTEHIFADAIVLAAGGIGQLYAHTTNPTISTGDGIAMAQRVGAKLQDMEFIQFHPTAFIHNNKTKFLLSEALRGEGAYLRNAQGERFMSRYDIRKELAPRDIVARAIYAEEKKGPVYLDLRHIDSHEVHVRFPSLTTMLKKYKLDLAKDLIPISPAAHYLCGGIAVNLKGETSIKNLYAFGEVAYTGVHGANRLASNSLLEAVVFARTISKQLSAHQKNKVKNTATKSEKIYLPTSLEKNLLRKVKHALQHIMWSLVGVIRTQKELEQALEKIDSLEQKLARVKTSLLKYEAVNILSVARVITKSALARKKSLGCHYRTN